MSKIIGIKFDKEEKINFYNATGFKLEKNTNVIVETEKGEAYAKVFTDEKTIDESQINNYPSVIRVATSNDDETYNKNVNDSKKALKKAIELAKDLNLCMSFVDVKYTFDRKQLLFYFLSDSRVDFRELAKELAAIYRTRIELRQIGVRDKAKEVSGIGPCGRQICCSYFLRDLDSVSINMAKNQNLALNPTKINGLCGRLLCCLKYEDDLYTENKSCMPEVGNKIKTEQGEGYVTFIDIPNKKYIVNVEDVGKVEVKIPDKCDNCERRNTK